MPTIKVMSWNIENLSDTNFTVYSNAFCNANLKKLKTTEKGKSDTIDFMVSIIKSYGAHVVGIMEIRKNMGKDFVKLLTDKLPGWKGVYGTQQADASRKEQYLYIWDQSAGSPIAGLNTQATPSTHWLYGIVDDNLLDSFFRSLDDDNTAEMRVEIYEALLDEGYIELVLSANAKERKALNKKAKKAKPNDDEDEYTDDVSSEELYTKDSRTQNYSNSLKASPKSRVGGDTPVDPSSLVNLNFAYRLIPDMWLEMQKDDFVMDIKYEDGDSILDVNQNTLLKNTLIQAGITLFPRAKDRSPFLMNLNLKNGGNVIPFLLALIHSPAPPVKSSSESIIYYKKAPYAAVYSTVNSLQACVALQNANNFLIMGDMNVGALQAGQKVSALIYDLVETTKGNAFVATGSENWGTNPFLPLTAAADKRDKTLAAKSLISVTQKTSLTTAQKAIDIALTSTPLWNLTPDDYLSEPYDKFFFKCKNAGEITEKGASVADLIAVMNSANRAGNYNANVARAGMLYYKQQITDVDYAGYKKAYNNLLTRMENNPSVSLGSVLDKRSRDSLDESTSLTDVKAKRSNVYLSNYRKGKNRVDALKTLINNLDQLETMVANKTTTVPRNSGVSFLAYRRLSDHLPIVAEFSFGTDTV